MWLVNRDPRENGESAHAFAMGGRGGWASRCEIPDKAGAGAARKTADWSVEFKQEV